MNQFKNLMDAFGASLGIKEWEQEGEDYCFFSFEKRILIHFRHNEKTNELILFSGLGELDAEQRAELTPRFLQANLFWEETGGATLGVTQEEGLVILCQREPLSTLDMPGLQTKIEEWLPIAEKWKAIIESQEKEPPSSPPSLSEKENFI